MAPHNPWRLFVLILLCESFLVFSAKAQEGIVKAQSWQHVKQQRKGSVVVYWYESRPFIYSTSKGMMGIEHDIMEGFKKYLKDIHGIELDIHWKEAKDFGDTYTLISNHKVEGTFGGFCIFHHTGTTKRSSLHQSLYV